MKKTRKYDRKVGNIGEMMKKNEDDRGKRR